MRRNKRSTICRRMVSGLCAFLFFWSMGMKITGTAYFVPDPSRLEDLIVPHRLSAERPYEIVKTITLGAMDYGNFITDMLADRPFIEENHELCSKGAVWRCLLVRKKGLSGGILVMPEDESCVGWAAYITK